jgi:hypothetical protein
MRFIILMLLLWALPARADDGPHHLFKDPCRPKTMKDGTACKRQTGKPGKCRWIRDHAAETPDYVAVCSKDDEELCFECVDPGYEHDLKDVLAKGDAALKGKGDLKQAAAALQAVIGLEQRQECLRRFTLARIESKLGHYQEAYQLNDFLTGCKDGEVIHYNSGCFHALAKDRKTALGHLATVTTLLSGRGATAEQWAKYGKLFDTDEDLAALRGDKDFAALRARIKAQEGWAKDHKGLVAVCNLDPYALWIDDSGAQARGPCKPDEKGQCKIWFVREWVPAKTKLNFAKCKLPYVDDEADD